MTEQYTADQIFSLKLTAQNNRFNSKDHIILLTFDDNYLDQSINLILSIARHNPQGVSFICVGPQLSEKSVQTLLSLNQGIQVRCYAFSLDYQMGRWAISAVLRLFCPWLLDEDIHRVIYMDSDILCSGSLQELFDAEVACIAMCNEISGNTGTYQQEVIRKVYPTRIYCNSGVVIFNLDSLRTNHTFSEIFQNLNGCNGKFHYLDQDFLNVYFGNKMNVLNAFQYNFQPHELHDTPYFKNGLKYSRLIHFSVGKPWIYKSKLYLIRLYLKHSEYEPMIHRVKKTFWMSVLYSPIRFARHMLSPFKQAWLAHKNK